MRKDNECRFFLKLQVALAFLSLHPSVTSMSLNWTGHWTDGWDWCALPTNIANRRIRHSEPFKSLCQFYEFIVCLQRSDGIVTINLCKMYPTFCTLVCSQNCYLILDENGMKIHFYIDYCSHKLCKRGSHSAVGLIFPLGSIVIITNTTSSKPTRTSTVRP